MNKLLTITEGSCGYNSKVIVSGVNLTLHSGEFIILEGDNGSGKSTLIKTLLGLLPSIDGAFNWNIDQSSIGYVPQDISLDLSAPASALDVVSTSFLWRGKNQKSDAQDALHKVGLQGKEHQRFGTLSGGERRRVLFARALVTNPDCFILDEPTVNMDKATESELGTLLHELVTVQNKAVIATSHVTEWVNHSRCCSIKDGKFYE